MRTNEQPTIERRENNNKIAVLFTVCMQSTKQKLTDRKETNWTNERTNERKISYAKRIQCRIWSSSCLRKRDEKIRTAKESKFVGWKFWFHENGFTICLEYVVRRAGAARTQLYISSYLYVHTATSSSSNDDVDGIKSILKSICAFHCVRPFHENETRVENTFALANNQND